MNSTINTYEDLLIEKQRLQELLRVQKEIIRQDLNEIKEELAPVKSAISFIGKFTTKGTGNPLVNGTMNTVIDLVVRKLVLGRAGWLTKLVVPLLVKNYTSHVIDENKDSIFRKLFSWFGGKKKTAGSNGRMVHIEEEEED
jgi:hypothetical protein